MVHSPNGYVSAKGLKDRLKVINNFHDPKLAEKLNLGKDWLITDETPFDKRIAYHICEWDVLIDSSNMGYAEHKKIAESIKQNYDI